MRTGIAAGLAGLLRTSMAAMPVHGGQSQPTSGARRDRRGRGVRGPLAWPPIPAMATRREAFDDLVRDVADDLDRVLEAHDLVVEFAVMDFPTDLGRKWAPEVPLARSVPATRSTPARVILFRRPIVARATGRNATVGLVRSVLISEISDLFAIPPEELDAPDDF